MRLRLSSFDLFRSIVAVLLLGFVGACSDSPLFPGDATLVAAPPVSGTPGWYLDDSLAVRVTNASGQPVGGALVKWTMDADGALLSADTSHTGPDGWARVAFVPGWSLGTQTVRATAAGESIEMSIEVTGMVLEQVEMLDHRVCGLDASGRLWCWAEYTKAAHPMRLESARRPIPAATSLRFTTLRANEYADYPPTNPHFGLCAVSTDGELWCARTTDFVGPKRSASSVPTLHQITTPVPFRDISIGNHFGDFMCGLDTTNRAWCKGTNTYGQLGDGTQIHRDDWVLVAGAVPFAELAAGDRSTCAVALNGRPYCWGANFGQRLGFGPASSAVLEPHPIDADLRLESILPIDGGVCGVTAIGAKLLRCWGAFTLYAFTNPLPLVPGSVVGLPEAAVSIGGDGFGGRFVSTDGRLYRFGWNGGGISDFAYRGDDRVEPTLTRLERLLTQTSSYWCVRHADGATLCATVFDRPVAVPLPAP